MSAWSVLGRHTRVTPDLSPCRHYDDHVTCFAPYIRYLLYLEVKYCLVSSLHILSLANVCISPSLFYSNPFPSLRDPTAARLLPLVRQLGSRLQAGRSPHPRTRGRLQPRSLFLFPLYTISRYNSKSPRLQPPTSSLFRRPPATLHLRDAEITKIWPLSSAG